MLLTVANPAHVRINRMSQRRRLGILYLLLLTGTSERRVKNGSAHDVCQHVGSV